MMMLAKDRANEVYVENDQRAKDELLYRSGPTALNAGTASSIDRKSRRPAICKRRPAAHRRCSARWRGPAGA